jgi:PAS domain S-box-containing protein
LNNSQSPFDEREAAIRAERRRLENFARVSGGWFWQTDANHRFIYMSESVREVTGLAPEWHYGKTRQDLGMPAEVTEADWAAHLATLRNHEPFQAFIFQRPGPDGLKWMQTSGTPVFDEGGAFVGYQGIATDISAQVEAQREARLLKDAIEEFNESFALWDADQRLVICNRRFREINAAVPEVTQPGTLFRDHVTAVVDAGLASSGGQPRKAWIEDRVKRFNNPGEPLEVRRHDGTWLWDVEQRMANGATVTTSTDITLVKQAQSEADSSYQQLQDAIEALPASYIAYDKDERIVMTNSRYRRSFNVKSPDDIHGLPLEELLRTNLRRGNLDVPEDEWESWIETRLAQHRTPGHVIEQRLKTGEYFRFVDSVTSDGGIIRFGLDISELKRQQEQLEEARKTAEEANQAKSEFLATISHAIRTPLNGILGIADLMRDGAMDADQRERLEHIIASGNALQAIINDVLDMSKIEAGAIVIERAPFDMASLVASVSSLFGDMASDKGLDFKVGVLPDEAHYLLGDATRIRQILWNLLSNEVKFTESGAITLGFDWKHLPENADDNHSLRIEIRDTGIGIEQDRLNRIFDPFVQADASTTRRFGGTGLGLAIIRHLVEIMGGSIRVESEYGKGSTFNVTIPLERADPSAIERRGGQTPHVLHIEGRPLRILVAEDHPLNALVTTELLQRNGHETVHVENGRDAVTAVNDGDFDLVLMDSHMPEMDGKEAARLIREHPTHGDLVIIGLTADAFVDQHNALREAGMNAVVTKPFTDDELMSAIWAHLKPEKHRSERTTDKPSDIGWKADAEAAFRAFADARDPDMIRKLLGLGRDSAVDRLKDLRAAVDAGDSAQIRFLARTLKGSSGTLFARRLSELARDIELVNGDIGAVRAKMPEFEACMTETLEWWSELAENLQPPPST